MKPPVRYFAVLAFFAALLIAGIVVRSRRAARDMSAPADTRRAYR